MTKAPATKGIGWSKGTASQVSLPSILFPRPGGDAGIGLGDRAGTRRQPLIENLLEQSVGDRAEGEWGRHDALFGELDIAFRRELRSVSARLAEPGIEVLRRHGLDFKMHVGKSVAAYLSHKAAKAPHITRGEGH